jgi:tetratricopeptide (TPR) repeat protein/peroxiredoxin
MTRLKKDQQLLSRRTLLKSLGAAPLILRPAPFFASSFLFDSPASASNRDSQFPFADIRLTPHYPAQSPLADVLRFVPPGSDEYITEQYAVEIELLLKRWSQALKASARDLSTLSDLLDASIEATPLSSVREAPLRSGFGVDVTRRAFDAGTVPGRDRFLQGIPVWLGQASKVETGEFEIYSIEQIASAPLSGPLSGPLSVRTSVRTEVRYDIVAGLNNDRREERVGSWRIEWMRDGSAAWKARRWEAGEETLSIVDGPAFLDVTFQALGKQESYRMQMLRGADHWRTVLDGAIGMDVYSNNGVAAGDFDNDGFDDFYVCQPAGLPNRLYRNRGDGTFDDVTEKAGVGVLDNTACALFVDFRNSGLQDLLVVCGAGPMLFLNQGDGTFQIKHDAFQFARVAQGTFTHAAVADYDRDGRLDIYFCTYMYYLGLDQYHYPIPYFDARNGPPNCLFHNEGNATFVETTEVSGMNADNDRYSFSCAWGDSNSNGLPDLFVANDFGSSQLYRNNGDGTFTVASREAHVEVVGAGMGCSWCDYDNDGHQDVYVPSMWEAAGQRVSEQKQFHENAPQHIRELYQRHARGNALYRNQGNGKFENVGRQAGVEMGRWSWSSDFWDFDHDGYSDLYVANGYISSVDRDDMASFFWRQVVAKSSDDATPAPAYEHGWNAINELIRSDHTWHGYARNVMFANNRDGTFSEISGPSGLDFVEDSRTFVLADLDHDGRLEVILKNRNAPQLRILHNAMKEIGHSIAFRLRGRQSNRDAIGSAVTVDAGTLRQTKYLQAGTGFLAQHSKELFFGVGKAEGTIKATIRWPNGLIQQFAGLPVNHRFEIEEGSAVFAAKPFAAPTPAYAHAGLPATLEPLPSQADTWLIDPLKAPRFSLPDRSGNLQQLHSLQGSFVLLTFFATTAQSSLDQVRRLNRRRSELAASQLQVLAVNVDQAGDRQAAQSFATGEASSLTVLFATEEVAGIYNIVYRYLFDRRRDLGIPTSFLLDKSGMIVKVYQGPVDTQRLLEDVQSVPTTRADRLRRATPFLGTLFQSTFERNDFTYGVALFQHGYLEQAAESFQQVVAAKPDDPDAYYNLGTLALRRNDFSAARQYLEQTLKLRPNYPEAWNNLGMMAAQQGRPEEAIQNFQHSLELRPKYAIALLNLGNVYRRQRDFPKAEEALHHALELEPDDPEINYSLGMLYAQQDQMTSGAEYLQRALALRPAYPEALNNLGVLYVKEQDYQKAEEQFRIGIRLVPNDDRSYLNLARLCAMRGDKDKAREVLQDLLRIQPGNAGAQKALERLQ